MHQGVNDGLPDDLWINLPLVHAAGADDAADDTHVPLRYLEGVRHHVGDGTAHRRAVEKADAPGTAPAALNVRVHATETIS